MGVHRAKLLLLPVFMIVVFVLGARVAKETSVPTQIQAQTPPADSPEACLADALTDYMNTVIEGAEGLSNIRLLSPAFNLTSGVEPVVFNYMTQFGARFGDLYGFAGNTYTLFGDTNGDGVDETIRAMDWYQRNGWAGAFGSRPVIFTEFGDFRLENPPGGNRNAVIESMATDFRQAVSGGIVGINYFAALAGNDIPFNDDPAFVKHRLTEDELFYITSGGSRRRAGLNQGITVQSGAIQNKAEGIGFGWVTEIIMDPGAIDSVVQSVNAQPNIQTVIRMCVKDQPCPGFEDPEALVQFLVDLNGRVNRPVYVLAGPNEPASEPWVEGAEECGLTTEPDTIDPFTIYDVPCNQTYQSRNLNGGREFHSLRPYPASPCDRAYNPDIQTYMCGHSLIAKQVYEVTRADCVVDPTTGQSCMCRQQADGSELCTYTVSGSMEVEIDLTDAELPIVGNTEDVPNAVSANSNGLTFAQRMNEYVSWYLHGSTYRGEEPPENVYLFGNNSPFPRPFDRGTPEYNRIINAIINFSGPIRKLLPFIHVGEEPLTPGGSQVGLRLQQQENAFDTRHNQVVACTIYDLLLNSSPVSCYSEARGNPTYRWWRVADGDLNPFNDLNIPIFIPGLINERVRVLRSYFPIFDFIPFSSTEDLVGRGATQPESPILQPGGGLGEDPSSPVAELIPNAEGQLIEFTPTSTTDSDNRPYHTLYFAHMQETSELAEYLQQTYLPEGMDGLTDVPDTIGELLSESPYCEILESRTNPGDSLHGDYAGADPDNPETEIGAILGYTARFTCQFDPPLSVRDPEEFNQCLTICQQTGDPNCAQQCDAQEQTCQKNVLAALNVQSFTPRAGDLWSRLVMGAESVFRRMFPRVEEGAPIDEIEDIPAHSLVRYSAENRSSDPRITGTEALAGDPELSRNGAGARIYFPHLGSVHEYFLKQIQKALRPYNLGSALPPTGSAPVSGEALQHLFEPTCNGQLCYEYIINQTVAQARCGGEYLNPYVTVAISLSETGGLVSNQPDGSNVKHFGCDPFGRAGVGYSIIEKFECMINTFTNSCRAGRTEAQALASYGYNPGSNLNTNLVRLLGLEQETRPNGYNFDLWIDRSTAQLFASRLLSTLPGQRFKSDVFVGWENYYRPVIEAYSRQ